MQGLHLVGKPQVRYDVSSSDIGAWCHDARMSGSHDKNCFKEASVAMLFHLHGWEMGARSMVLAQLPPVVIHADLKAQKLILGTGDIDKAWLKDYRG